MIIKLLSAALILFTVFMGVKHGWAALSANEETMAMMDKMPLNKTLVQLLGFITLLGTVLILFPPTFFWGCILNACLIVVMMGLFLSVKDFKGVLIEIPFLLIPLLLIYLKHPLASE